MIPIYSMCEASSLYCSPALAYLYNSLTWQQENWPYSQQPAWDYIS